jgi:hypothetical protein
MGLEKNYRESHATKCLALSIASSLSCEEASERSVDESSCEQMQVSFYRQCTRTLGRDFLMEVNSAQRLPLTCAVDPSESFVLCRRKQGNWHSEQQIFISTLFTFCTLILGHAVVLLVEPLYYKREGRRFYSRWAYWIFLLTCSFQPHCGPGVDSGSKTALSNAAPAIYFSGALRKHIIWADY